MPVQTMLLGAPLALSLWTHPRWPAHRPQLLPDAPDAVETVLDLLDEACQPDVSWRMVDTERPGIELRRRDRVALWTADRWGDAAGRALLSRWDRQTEAAGGWPRAGVLGLELTDYPAATAEELRRRGVGITSRLRSLAGRHGQSLWVVDVDADGWHHAETRYTHVGAAAVASRALLDRYADVLAGGRGAERRLAA